jgi:large subunit ribosomal protein L20
VKKEGLSYSVFIDLLNKKNVGINRKMMAELIKNNPDAMKRIIEQVK